MNSPLRFPWEDMKERLDNVEGNWAMQHYLNSEKGYISNTLGAHAERVKAGTQSPPRRDTCAYIYHIQSGSGRSEITKSNGETKTIEWEKSDTFSVPTWSKIVHFADSSSDAYFFVLSDRPMLEALQMYSEDKSL